METAFTALNFAAKTLLKQVDDIRLVIDHEKTECHNLVPLAGTDFL
jgi:hypothetical protein